MFKLHWHQRRPALQGLCSISSGVARRLVEAAVSRDGQNTGRDETMELVVAARVTATFVKLQLQARPTRICKMRPSRYYSRVRRRALRTDTPAPPGRRSKVIAPAALQISRVTTDLHDRPRRSVISKKGRGGAAREHEMQTNQTVNEKKMTFIQGYVPLIRFQNGKSAKGDFFYLEWA